MNRPRLWWTSAALLACLFILQPLPAQEAREAAPKAQLPPMAQAVLSGKKRTSPLTVEDVQSLFPEAQRDESNHCLTFCLEKARLVAFLDASGQVGFISINTPSGEKDKVTSRLAALLQLRNISHKAQGCTLLIDEELLRKGRISPERALIPSSRMAFIDALLDWDESASDDQDRSLAPRDLRKPDIRFTGWKSSKLCFRIRDYIPRRAVSYEMGIPPNQTELHSILIQTQTRLTDEELSDCLKRRLRLDGHYSSKGHVKHLRDKTGFIRLLLYSKFHGIYVGAIKSSLYGLMQKGAKDELIPNHRIQPAFPPQVSAWPGDGEAKKKDTPRATPSGAPITSDTPSPGSTADKAAPKDKKASASSDDSSRKEASPLTPQQALRAYIQKLRAL